MSFASFLGNLIRARHGGGVPVGPGGQGPGDQGFRPGIPIAYPPAGPRVPGPQDLGWVNPYRERSYPAQPGLLPENQGGVIPDWRTIPLIPVVSSNVQAIGYDATTRFMLIQFKGKEAKPGRPSKGPSLYGYRDIAPGFFQTFANAPSKGKFVWEQIRSASQVGTIAYVKIYGPGALQPDRTGRKFITEQPSATYHGPEGRGYRAYVKMQKKRQGGRVPTARFAKPWWRRKIGI
jgi:hypothetical protein